MVDAEKELQNILLHYGKKYHVSAFAWNASTEIGLKAAQETRKDIERFISDAFRSGYELGWQNRSNS